MDHYVLAERLGSLSVLIDDTPQLGIEDADSVQVAFQPGSTEVHLHGLTGDALDALVKCHAGAEVRRGEFGEVRWLSFDHGGIDFTYYRV